MSKKIYIIVAVILLIAGAIGGYYLYLQNDKNTKAGIGHSQMPLSKFKPNYTLDLMSGKSYLASTPVMLHFAIQSRNGNIQKDFDTVNEKKMHLIVVRKDRTNFQHVHPTFDKDTGMFMIEPFTFPTDGDYRVYADFTPLDAQKDEMGMKMAVTPYQDVSVGDPTKYSVQTIGDVKLASSANGIDTNIFFAPSDDSPGGKLKTDFYAGQDSTVAIELNQSGKPYTNLQKYLGGLGHMVVLGPKLEFVHADTQSTDVNSQSGLIIFAVNFPQSGQYKLFLQTQAVDRINLTEYILNVQASQP